MSAEHLKRAALKKLSSGGPVPPDFEFFHYKVLPFDGIQLQGGVPRILKSGPRKGQKSWDRKQARITIVTAAEVEIEEKRWSSETGLCPDCLGEGQVFARWNKDTGTTYRACRTCLGTGKAA